VLPLPGAPRSVDLGWLLPTVLYFAGNLAILRTIPFVRGVLSLLDLNSEMTEKAIKRRNRQEVAERDRSIADSSPMALPTVTARSLMPTRSLESAGTGPDTLRLDGECREGRG